MSQSITQKLDYGCGVACFAFIVGCSFDTAIEKLGREYSVKHGWRPSDLVQALSQEGLNYENKYIREKTMCEYPEGCIVLIERSQKYAVGHYLVSTSGCWMDPWINMVEDNNVNNAKSGFRDTLPGKAMYMLTPSINK